MVSYSTGLQTAFVRIRDSRIFAVSLSDKTRLPGQGYPLCQTAGRQVVWTPEEQAAVWHSMRQRETLAWWLVPRRRNCREKRPQIRTIRCGTPPIERGEERHPREGGQRKPRDLVYPRHRRGAPHRRDARTQTDADARAWGMTVGARNCPTWHDMGHKMLFSSLAKEWGKIFTRERRVHSYKALLIYHAQKGAGTCLVRSKCPT